eukprot:3367356-Amphidinium_carterae.1
MPEVRPLEVGCPREAGCLVSFSDACVAGWIQVGDPQGPCAGSAVVWPLLGKGCEADAGRWCGLAALVGCGAGHP